MNPSLGVNFFECPIFIYPVFNFSKINGEAVLLEQTWWSRRYFKSAWMLFFKYCAKRAWDFQMNNFSSSYFKGLQNSDLSKLEVRKQIWHFGFEASFFEHIWLAWLDSDVVNSFFSVLSFYWQILSFYVKLLKSYL